MLNVLLVAAAFNLEIPAKLKEVVLAAKCEECFTQDGFAAIGVDRRIIENEVLFVCAQL